MKKIKYLIISIVILCFTFLSNAIIYKITDYNVLENTSKSFLAMFGIYTAENDELWFDDDNFQIEGYFGWTEKNIAEFWINTTSFAETNNRNKDIVYILDTSLSNDEMGARHMEEIFSKVNEGIFQNENNRYSVITFNKSGRILTNFTSDYYLVNEMIYETIYDGNTEEAINYNVALKKLDELLSTYEKTNDRDLVVFFITDGKSGGDKKSYTSSYNLLKEKYPYLSINGVLLKQNNVVIDHLKSVTDSQIIVSGIEDSNKLLSIINGTEIYNDATLKMELSDNFNMISYTSSVGEININDDNQLVWYFGDNYSSGSNNQAVIRFELSSDKQQHIGFYNLNNEINFSYTSNGKLNNIKDEVKLVLTNGYNVFYDLNLPDGCSISKIDDNKYLIGSKVNIADNLYCEGYNFLGFDIRNDVEMINDKSFIMPYEDVFINAKWSKQSLVQSIDGVVREKTTLYDKMEELANNTSLVKRYTGEHKDSFTQTATHDIYHFYATSNAVATSVLNKNNVIFADHCWQILRTTDTGGVKLIYNGEPDTNGKCGTDRENHVGYSTTPAQSLNSSYYYGTSYNYDSSTKTFSLAGNLVKETWSDITSSSLIGKYTCKSATEEGTCSTLYLIKSYYSSSKANAIRLNSNSHYSQFGELQFNASYNSPAYVGYMYGDVYASLKTDGTKNETFTKTQTILSNSTLNTTYYYSDTVDYGTQNSGKYTLVNSYLISSSDEYPNLIGKYTFRNTSSSYSSTNVYYISYINGSTMYYKQLSNGEMLEELLFGDTIVDNGDGTYTLENTTTVEYKDWYTNYANYSDKYTCNSQNAICSNPRYVSATSNTGYTYVEVSEKIMISKTREDLKLNDTLLVSKDELIKNNTGYNEYKYTCNTTSDTCTDATLRMITSLSSTGYTYAINRYFGASVSYENGKYTLVNPLGLESATNLDDISTHHYICLNGTTECDNVAYIYYYTGTGTMYYITLKNGELSVNDALDKMLNKNTTDSTIKLVIDAWYEKYLLEYSSYLEDVVYCNDRSYKDFNNSGWNENGGNTNSYLYFKQNDNTTDLSCTKQTDQFSVSNDFAKLKYPIGLATSPELNILNNNTVRKTGMGYWLASSIYFSSGSANVRNVNSSGNMLYNSVNANVGVRPAVSLRSGIEYTGGDGSVDSPYVIE